jgi:hypothetical protein
MIMKNYKLITIGLFVLCAGIVLESCKDKDEVEDVKIKFTETFQPSASKGKDAMLWSVRPDDNFAVTQVQSVTATSWVNQGFGDGTQRSLLEFDLSSIQQGADIESAKLSLYRFTDVGGNGGFDNRHRKENGDNSFLIELVSSSWEENTVTWNTMPSVDTDFDISVGSSTNELQNYENIDISKMVKYWLQNPSANHGVLLRLQTEIKDRGVILASSDHKDQNTHPKLVVVYTK